MIRIFVLLLACMGAVLPGGAEAATISREISPGGLSYMRIFIPDADKVAIRIAWPSNWAWRKNVNQAVPHVGAELMLLGGAKGFPAGKAVEQFADMKGMARLVSTPDYFMGVLAVPKKHLSDAVQIANAHLRAPMLDERWLRRVCGNLLNRVRKAQARPEWQGFAALRRAILGDTPLYQALSLDPPEQIISVTRAELVRWHRETLVRNGAKIVLAGNLNAREAGVVIDAIMKGLPEGERRARPVTRTNFSPRRILLQIPDAKAATLVFAGPLPSISKGGEIEDVLLASLLGGGPGSVLFDAVRTKLRAAYAIGTRLETYTRDIRLLVMAGQVKPARLADVEQAVRRAYADFRKNGTLQGLEHRKSRLAATIAKNMKDPLHISLSALLGWLAGQEPEMVVKLASEIRAVTPADIRKRLATAFPPSKQLIVLAVSPKADALPGACVITRPKEADRC